MVVFRATQSSFEIDTYSTPQVYIFKVSDSRLGHTNKNKHKNPQ